MIYSCFIETVLGKMFTAAEGDALIGLWFIGQKHFPDTQGWEENSRFPVFKGLEIWLKNYFNGKNSRINFELKPKGTDFQKAVWKKLLKIPWGKTISYGELFPASPRAAGNAVSRNPISILIPCHRVIGRDGSITGYAGGIWRKQALLELECAKDAK